MSKKKNYILLITLIIFSIYCALTVGETWDQKDSLLRGKITFDYLLSLGIIDTDILGRYYYSTIYWSFVHFITKIFPSQYQIETIHLTNLFFSLATIFGIGKLSKELFNRKVGQIIFLILFFYPIFLDIWHLTTKIQFLPLVMCGFFIYF